MVGVSGATPLGESVTVRSTPAVRPRAMVPRERPRCASPTNRMAGPATRGAASRGSERALTQGTEPRGTCLATDPWPPAREGWHPTAAPTEGGEPQ